MGRCRINAEIAMQVEGEYLLRSVLRLNYGNRWPSRQPRGRNVGAYFYQPDREQRYEAYTQTPRGNGDRVLLSAYHAPTSD